MARSRDRVIALILTVVFFGTSFALSFFVIWELVKDNKETKNVDTTADTSMQGDSSQAADGTKLEGTALKDFTPVDKVTELQIIDTTPGTGAEVKVGDRVNVDYTGAVALTGLIFQSSLDFGEPVTLSLGGVIAGWQEGMVGMKEGGTRRLLIPAEKAYGANPPQGIPVNADLVFDITLHKITKD